MQLIKDYNDRQAASGLVRSIRQIADRLSPRLITLMEVCGTHTTAIMRSGLRSLLPGNIRLISGPGCPVCVSPPEVIDAAIAVAEKPDVALATFGDMIRVPTAMGSLETAKARGAQVETIYSPTELISLARSRRDRRIVFFAVGFETTAPAIAWAIAQAKEEGLKNLLIISACKLLPPALETLTNAGDVALDGLICPGHVSTIIGASAFDFLARKNGIPSVIAGFEPLDILLAIYMLLCQMFEGRQELEIEYSRAVSSIGNKRAQEVIASVFQPVDSVWRGFGAIKKSGLALRESYYSFDALRQLDIPSPQNDSIPDNCLCGEVLRGMKSPDECALFRGACTPETPLGPCIVSSEGACAALYAFNSDTTGSNSQSEANGP